MERLYRVLPAAQWKLAQQTGEIPQCGADKRDGVMHLNCASDVAFVTAHYFRPEEEPVALELDLAGLEGKLSWLSPSKAKPWQQPLLKVPCLKTRWVTAVHPLAASHDGGKLHFHLEHGKAV